MTNVPLALVTSLPWIVLPIVAAVRLGRSRSLDEEAAEAPGDAPLVSVVVPARGGARDIGRCVRSLLASTYPRLECVGVDDHSTDGTADLAREAAAGDARLRVLTNPDLPDGWFGKQWACATGAAAATGELLLFVDADTAQAPDLVTRLVNAQRARDADLISVAGKQELGSFWERLVQPQVFAILAVRYGGTETVSTSPRASDKIANGQCLMMRRATYERLGGHAAVKDKVAEDLMMAQRTFEAGGRVALVLGERQLATRMYTSLRELVRGWRKNIYAGGVDAMPGGAVGRALFPLLFPLPALMALAPPVCLAIGLPLGLGTLTLWAAVCTAAQLVWWAAVSRGFGIGAWHALLYPLGSLVLLGIMLQAIARGRNVEWKGRGYVAR